jgi:hypothetical protein
LKIEENLAKLKGNYKDSPTKSLCGPTSMLFQLKEYLEGHNVYLNVVDK